jgi:DNA polymerase III delta prime subunit
MPRTISLRISDSHAPESGPSATEKLVDNAHDDLDYDDASSNSGKGHKKRTRRTDAVKDKKKSAATKGQASLDMFTRGLRTQAPSESAVGNGDAPTEASLEVDPNHARSKRRKTTPPMPSLDPPTSAQPHSDTLDWHQQLQAEAGMPPGMKEITRVASDTDVMMVDISRGQADTLGEVSIPSTALDALPPVAEEEVAISLSNPIANEPKKATPKKQMKVTKSGKLVSSPPPPALDTTASPKKRRGRKPTKAKILHTATVIRYGTDAASRSTIGQKIEDILNGKKPSAGRAPAPKKVPSKPAAPPKVTHPFFQGKPQKDAPVKAVPEQKPPTPRKSAITPGKLRAELRREQSPDPVPAFGGGLRTDKAVKHSGLNEAPWPTGENAHVRNLDTGHSPQRLDHLLPVDTALRPRKLKNAVLNLPEDEDVILRLGEDLARDILKRKVQPTSEFEPPEDVRLPTRLLTLGTEIQRRVQKQLLAQLPLSCTPEQRLQAVHPAITDLFNDIAHTLTPFDEGRCETQTWTQKYSPKNASQVLQTGQEAVVLKDWLQSLTVMAVGGTLKATTMLDAKKPPRKKRKKAIDDFIVDDNEEDEEEEMVVLHSAEDGSNPQSRSLRLPQWTRNKNVVLISGPHGCGKSATVYAVAKDLGFEVFEIHAGMRRSGKDIQDKVGDMTANHLVNHKRSAASVQEVVQPGDHTDDDLMDKALEKDITSGRQATMASFFQAKPKVTASKPKAKAKIPEVKKAPTSTAQATLPLAQASRTSQKQSLILIEEADILFDEDQQFWAQVTKIASLSKRPIVITCNDERQIPMQDLPLAAILRLQPAPVDLATDYMLVLTGREGHILKREAVSDLYESKNHDLRASIMELDLWCQMSVGDKKGGLEWMYQRWPPGKDVDEHGQVLRVASEGTYTSGMGWLSHNVFQTQRNAAFDKEEELLQEVWTDWGVTPATWRAPETKDEQIPDNDPASHIKELVHLDVYADAFSAADIYCRIGLPTYESDHNEPADASQPPITDKARLSYTLAAPLLQVDHCTDFLGLDSSISVQTHLLVQRAYPDLSQHHSLPGISKPQTETDYAKAILQLRKDQTTSLTRSDFANALDILAAPPDAPLPERTSFALTPSSFDRTFSVTTLDLAPYVRSIVAHEQILEAQRIRMSNLLSAGGTGKRARTTRASRVALEGGVRETKRRDRWFDESLDFWAVMKTAGKEWAGLGWKGEEEGTASLAGTQDSEGDVEMKGLQETV